MLCVYLPFTSYSRKTFACGSPEKGMAKVSHKAHGRSNGFVPAFVSIPTMPIPGGVRVCLFFAVSGGRAIVRGKRLRTNSGVSETWSYRGLSPIFDQTER